MEEQQYTSRESHKLTVTNRGLLSATGVSDVISFDVKEVLLETSRGMLTIKGQDLHVKRLTLEKGEVDLEGTVDGISYSEVHNVAKSGESFLTRMFK